MDRGIDQERAALAGARVAGFAKVPGGGLGIVRALAALGLVCSVAALLSSAPVRAELEAEAAPLVESTAVTQEVAESSATQAEETYSFDEQALLPSVTANAEAPEASGHAAHAPVDYWSMLLVFVLATFIGIGVIGRVSRLLHTPLMSLTNAISAIAVVGSIVVTGADYPLEIRMLGAVALFASMTNIVSGFLITDRMLRMFKQKRGEGANG